MAVTITATGPTALRSFVYPDANGTMLVSPTTPAVGDLFYAGATNGLLTRLAVVAVGSVLVSGATPAWSASPTLTTLTVTATLSVGNSPAASGQIRIPNNQAVTSANFAGNGVVYLGYVDTSDRLVLGYTGSHVVPYATASQDLGTSSLVWRTGYFGTALVVGTNPSTADAIRLPNASNVTFRNAANSANFFALGVSGANVLFLGDATAAAVEIDGPIVRLAGSTASFPALKRSAAILQCRLADDSAYAQFDALGYSAGGTAGINGSLTTAALVGKTMTFVNGIMTAFA